MLKAIVIGVSFDYKIAREPKDQPQFPHQRLPGATLPGSFANLFSLFPRDGEVDAAME
jgi:hypothetical protein